VLRRSLRLLMVVALLFGSVVATAAAGVARQGDDRPELRLDAGRGGERPSADDARLNSRGQGYYVVQFGGPIAESSAGGLADAGAEVLSYLPDFAYKVRMRPSSLDAAGAVGGVVDVSAFAAEYKVSPDLAAEGLYTIRIERGVDRAELEADIADAGLDVLSASGRVITVRGQLPDLAGVAELADVAWIQDFEIRETHNEYGAGQIIGGDVANGLGYDGSTQVVAVADTGLGDGTAAGAHPDIPASRVVDVQDWAGVGSAGCYSVTSDGAQDVDSGHGTHVSVSVLGDGDASGRGQGTAPAASLVFQATEDYTQFEGICSLLYEDGYYLLGLPDDLQDLLQAAYDQGARIHSDSWGSDAAGDYTADSASVDDFMWDNPDFLMTTSAGNAGVDGNANGEVDADSTGSPATAKNVLTVGASENDRDGDWSCDSSIGNGCTGQNDIFTYGSAWPADYPAAPLSNDPSAGNAEQMAAFSSRGPTDDGRIKPDIVAPGTWVLSGYSDLYQEGYDGVVNPRNGVFQYDGWGFPVSEEYKYMGGTSMSNPIAAGAAAVVRDYYEKAHSHSASGALTKASLINSAIDLLDENNDGSNDNDYPIPNNHEGWGRIDVANSVDGSAEWVDEATGVTTGASDSYNFTVEAGSDVKVTLVWADFASTESASVNLVNDLDLTVSGSSGTFDGNVFSGGWSTTGGSADRINNVENVYIQNADAGTYTVTVSGFNVPFGPQPYALVVDGVGEPGGNNPPAASFTSSCTDLDCDFTDTSSDSDGTVHEWWWTFGDGGTSTAQSPSHSYGSAGTYTVELTVTDDDGDSDTTSAEVTVTEPGGGTTMHVGDLDAGSIDTGRRWQGVVTVTVHDDTEAPVGGAEVTGLWSSARSGTGSCTTDATGSCDITSSQVRDSTVSVDFTMTTVTHGSLSYAAGDNHDVDGDSDGTTIVVPQEAGGNQSPTASFTVSCTGSSCDFDGSGSSDPDGTIAGYDWDFGDGGSDTGATPTHVYGADGSYTVTLTVTDDEGATGSTSQTVVIGDPPEESVHVGDLDATVFSRGSQWRTTVTVTVHDHDDAGADGITVSGTWSDGIGSGSCTTGSTGVCSLSSPRLTSSTPSATFTVTSLTGGAPYAPGSNHDPDSDSDGTSITVTM
jgi:PKD repeat protein